MKEQSLNVRQTSQGGHAEILNQTSDSGLLSEPPHHHTTETTGRKYCLLPEWQEFNILTLKGNPVLKVLNIHCLHTKLLIHDLCCVIFRRPLRSMGLLPLIPISKFILVLAGGIYEDSPLFACVIRQQFNHAPTP